MLGGVGSLIAAVDRGVPPLCAGVDGVEALRLEEAAREAARTRARVEVAAR
jgi:hypothetical protein